MSKRIPLTQGKFAIVDDEDYAILSKHTIVQNQSGEIEVTFWKDNVGCSFPISHIIMKVLANYVVVARNKNKFDLRKENLVSMSYSNFNHGFGNNYGKIKSKLSSKYRGVCIATPGKRGKRWKAQICHRNVRYATTFYDEIEAARWYNRKAKELFGEFAYQNKIK